MKILFLLAHATESARALYQTALGADVRVVPFIAPPLPGIAGGGLSSRYQALGQRLRGGPGSGRILPALLAFLGLQDEAADAVVMGWYSSGYALAREMAVLPGDRAAIAGWVGIDGGHAAEEADGSPVDRDVAWLAGLCREAATERTVLAYGHSDVDPIRYASTRETIAEALRLCGITISETRAPCAGCRLGRMGIRAVGGLRVERHDHRMDPVQEHVAALQSWGHDLAARAVSMVLRKAEERPCVAAPPSSPSNDPPPRAASLGELALEAARAELAAGAGEDPPGSNGGPSVAKYLAGCTRDGRPVGLTSGAWCASFAGWCDSMALGAMRVAGDDTEAPCRWRAAVWELVEDARRSGAWRERGEYSPLPGDLAVFLRAGQDPRVPGRLGHVGRVETAPDGNGLYRTIEGNSGHDGARVARGSRRITDRDLAGWISYQRHGDQG